ncbi:hypothetical protein GGP41_002444 [Bipolaris sorokiniana]|uniref:Hydrophobin n=1 Tax=Cochliobolus sativus TaxID=45130 RepID=A0A8H5ZGW5_COCSA|nr:hypothetical protein GGP41_002444 [Bipolaris sorokiniana]
MMNLKLIALCLGLHIAHSLGGPVNGASGTSLADAIEGSAEQVPASPEDAIIVIRNASTINAAVVNVALIIMGDVGVIGRGLIFILKPILSLVGGT